MIRLISEYVEKTITRPLYEETFSDDGKGFVDYYYEDRCFDNVILVDEEADDKGNLQVVSMIHLNPYKVFLDGREVDALYIFAVATKKAYRHQGRMRALLDASFSYAKENHVPFVFLIPVDTAIYTPFGFEVVGALRQSELSYDMIQKDYDVYCVRDEDYLRRMRKEEALTREGQTQKLPEHSVIMVKAFDDRTWDILRCKKCYFCEEV